MDRERDRDAAEALIEEHDEEQGGGEPERVRPGQGDRGSRTVDSQMPPPDEDRSSKDDAKTDDAKQSPDPGPFAPH